ncbi:hypothetical protein OKW41_003139 [Paraburkholderia sp. UCT70]
MGTDEIVIASRISLDGEVIRDDACVPWRDTHRERFCVRVSHRRLPVAGSNARTSQRLRKRSFMATVPEGPLRVGYGSSTRRCGRQSPEAARFPGSANFGLWPVLSGGHSNVASTQVTDLRAATVSVASSGGLFDACLADVKARRKNRNKSKILARIDYVCAVVKRLWRCTNVPYRGLAKNPNRAFVAQALAGIHFSRAQLITRARR